MNLYITVSLKNPHIAAAATKPLGSVEVTSNERKGLLRAKKNYLENRLQYLNKTELKDRQRSGKMVLSLTIENQV